jgi:hypothetical protein
MLLVVEIYRTGCLTLTQRFSLARMHVDDGMIMTVYTVALLVTSHPAILYEC